MFLIKKIVTTNQNMDNNNNNNNYFDEIEFDPLAELNNYYNKFIDSYHNHINEYKISPQLRNRLTDLDNVYNQNSSMTSDSFGPYIDYDEFKSPNEHNYWSQSYVAPELEHAKNFINNLNDINNTTLDLINKRRPFLVDEVELITDNDNDNDKKTSANFNLDSIPNKRKPEDDNVENANKKSKIEVEGLIVNFNVNANEEKLINQILEYGRKDDPVVNYPNAFGYDIDVEYSALHDVFVGEWLNGDVINSFFYLLQQIFPEYHYFDTLFMYRLLKETDTFTEYFLQNSKNILRRKMFIPFHFNANHWLLIVIDFEKLELAVYDSLYGETYTGKQIKLLEGVINKFIALAKLRMYPIKIVYKNSMQQVSGDCGVFVLLNALFLSCSLPLDYSHDNVEQFRKKIVTAVMMQSLDGIIQIKTKVEMKPLIFELDDLDNINIPAKPVPKVPLVIDIDDSDNNEKKNIINIDDNLDNNKNIITIDNDLDNFEFNIEGLNLPTTESVSPILNSTENLDNKNEQVRGKVLADKKARLEKQKNDSINKRKDENNVLPNDNRRQSRPPRKFGIETYQSYNDNDYDKEGRLKKNKNEISIDDVTYVKTNGKKSENKNDAISANTILQLKQKYPFIETYFLRYKQISKSANYIYLNNNNSSNHMNSIYLDFVNQNMEWFEPLGYQKVHANATQDYSILYLHKNIIRDWFRFKCKQEIAWKVYDIKCQENDIDSGIWNAWFAFKKTDINNTYETLNKFIKELPVEKQRYIRNFKYDFLESDFEPDNPNDTVQNSYTGQNFTRANVKTPDFKPWIDLIYDGFESFCLDKNTNDNVADIIFEYIINPYTLLYNLEHFYEYFKTLQKQEPSFTIWYCIPEDKKKK